MRILVLISLCCHSITKNSRVQGASDLRFYDLRYKATSKIFEKGLKVMEVAAITGHKDLWMLQKYTHLRATGLPLKLVFSFNPTLHTTAKSVKLFSIRKLTATLCLTSAA